MPKPISYGVLVINEMDQLLLAHVTGQKHWDIPKGGADAGETPLQAALRETAEETGIVLDPASLEDLGSHAYLQNKDLYLFRARVTKLQCVISTCRCSSFFSHHRTGAKTPEADDFRWVYPDEIAIFCIPKLTAVISRWVSQAPAQPAS